MGLTYKLIILRMLYISRVYLKNLQTYFFL